MLPLPLKPDIWHATTTQRKSTAWMKNTSMRVKMQKCETSSKFLRTKGKWAKYSIYRRYTEFNPRTARWRSNVTNTVITDRHWSILTRYLLHHHTTLILPESNVGVLVFVTVYLEHMSLWKKYFTELTFSPKVYELLERCQEQPVNVIEIHNFDAMIFFPVGVIFS